MAGRRKPISFSQLDNLEPKGKGAILRSAEEVAAEQEQLYVEELELTAPENARKQASLETRKLGNKETSFSDQTPRAQLYPSPAPAYKKATYKLSQEALDALDEAKRLLRRTYGLKANLETIVEAAIMDVAKDLEENKETSFLVNWFAGKQENK